MKHLQLFEAFIHREQPIRDEFIKMNNVKYKSFKLKDLKKDCREYDVDFYNLVREIILGKKIAFQCTWCYNSDFSNEYPNTQKLHNIIGICKDIRFENPKYHDSDVLVKIDNEDRWHTLFTLYNDTKTSPNFNVRIYDYKEGLLIQKLETLKNIKKFNI